MELVWSYLPSGTGEAVGAAGERADHFDLPTCAGGKNF
jgi:hypothetical protein